MSTDEAGILSGDLTVHTTWSAPEAHVAVQYSGGSDWFTVTGSPVPCESEEGSRLLHQAVVDAVRAGKAASVPRNLPADAHWSPPAPAS